MKPWNNSQHCYVSDHPLVATRLAMLRDEQTSTEGFRRNLECVSQFLFYEAARGLTLREQVVTTPLETLSAAVLAKEVLLVPILRAGLAMSNAIRQICPASVGMLGMYRDHDTLQPIEYYSRIPEQAPQMEVFLLDPMLATGGSARAAIDALKQRGVSRIVMIALIGAPEGVAAIHAQHPEVCIYMAAMDRQLNEIGYILPGLGDAGDRYFGT